MNCREGDLAVIVRARFADNIGKIVRVLRLVSERDAVPWPGMPRGVLWAVTDGRETKISPDSWLRPIRDQPGEDEMLRIAGAPAELQT